MRILVTGATGFIGLPLTRHLVRQGHEILALSRSPLRSEKFINWLSADLSFPETYQDAIRSFEPEILIHLAWQDIPDFSFEKSENNLNHHRCSRKSSKKSISRCNIRRQSLHFAGLGPHNKRHMIRSHLS